MCFRLCFKCSAQGCCSCGGELTTDAPLTAARADVFSFCPSRRLGQPLLWDCITHRSEPYRHRPALLFRQQKREVVFSLVFSSSRTHCDEREATPPRTFSALSFRAPTIGDYRPLCDLRHSSNREEIQIRTNQSQTNGSSREPGSLDNFPSPHFLFVFARRFFDFNFCFCGVASPATYRGLSSHLLTTHLFRPFPLLHLSPSIPHSLISTLPPSPSRFSIPLLVYPFHRRRRQSSKPRGVSQREKK